MKKLILGLIGHKQTGKDTLCRIIQARYPQAVRVAIADPLKADIATRFHTTVDEIEAEKEFWRPVLQWWGEAQRAFWTSKAFLRIHAADTNLVVVTDARYPDQFDLIRAQGGLLIRVLRALDGPADTHPSEQNVTLAGADAFIMNPGDETFATVAESLWPLIDGRLGCVG